MGGCASKPKDLDVNELVPAEAPAADKPEAEPVAQENNGGEETKTEEPLVDIPVTTEEAKESSESTPSEEPTEVAETKAEEKVEAEEKTEAKAEAEEKTEAKAEEKTEAKAEEKIEAKAEEKTEAGVIPAAEVAVASETEKAPEPVEEAKVVEAQTSQDKSDAPLVTM
ncbi:hypothetical protein SOVF_173150 [Spinacia oleracea]|uniref:Uncharacterized protein n=1 Tax=Spinacia oleracea TaxID=3562 RepID=A0A9R0IZS4_SPIOL|nr:uncharacterized protein LOC110780012 [Spinacia oleracea]KNA07308.1 hypothetical protein SOVF_173150 [Spinacia oleracea]